MLGRFVGGPHASDAPMQFVFCLYVCICIASAAAAVAGVYADLFRATPTPLQSATSLESPASLHPGGDWAKNSPDPQYSRSHIQVKHTTQFSTVKIIKTSDLTIGQFTSFPSLKQ